MKLKKSKFILYLLFLDLFSKISNEIIMLKFNSSNKLESNYNLLFIEDLQKRNLISKIKIGEPQYEINSILSVQNDYLALLPNKSGNIEKNSNINYNYSKSSTFKNITCLNQFLCESKYDIIAQESIIIKSFNFQTNKTNEIILKNINLIFGINDK